MNDRVKDFGHGPPVLLRDGALFSFDSTAE